MAKTRRNAIEQVIHQNAPNKVTLGYIRGDEVDGEHHDSIIDMVMHDSLHERHISSRLHVAASRIASGRNQLAVAFMNWAARPDWLFMTDTDMVYRPDFLARLMRKANPRTCPVIGGLAFAGGKGPAMHPTIYTFQKDKDTGDIVLGREEDYPKDTLVKVDATGGACLLIHRIAFEAIWETWGGKTAYPFFAETESNLHEFGEDITFCMRCNMAGVPIHVDTGALVGHRKKYTMDEAGYERQRIRIEEIGLENFNDEFFAQKGLVKA
jgi:GT2 family glycosyltransferase